VAEEVGDLLDRLRSIAVARGCTRLEWTTDTSNGGAQSFHESLGAESLETKLFYRVTL
jgi:hypothetical protein